MILYLLCVLLNGFFTVSRADCGTSRSIYVPRQLSYNPVLENALTYNKKNDPHKQSFDSEETYPSTVCQDWNYLLSVKPIYTQTTGKALRRYFTINHKPCMQVQENGNGDIDPLWLQVISSNPTFYSSILSFKPTSKTGGSLLYFQMSLPCNFSFSIDTAVIHVSNDMHIAESKSTNLGTSPFTTVEQSLASGINCFGRICGARGKTGLDDIQVKLMYNVYDFDEYHLDVYGLFGIPTGVGSKSHYLFEPLVGSKHAQLGLGASAMVPVCEFYDGIFSVQGEVKWRYGFSGTERRSFDLKENGQWSRYMLLVKQSNLYAVSPAINTLTFKTSVTPRNSLDIYCAAHYAKDAWNVELGYDFWYRSPETIHIKNNDATLSTFGIADLLGISQLNPHTASSATISQSIAAGSNQMVSDAVFTALTTSDLHGASGAAPRSLSNTLYASLGYELDCYSHLVELGINLAYEKGTNTNKPDAIFGWLSFDIYL